METIATAEPAAEGPPPPAFPPAHEAGGAVPQGCGCGAGNAADLPPSYVYALGRIEMRFPSLGVEREVAQALGREATAGLTDRQALHAALAQPQNRYLLRQLCWVLSIEGLDTYLLVPRDPLGHDLLLQAVRTEPEPADVDVIIGSRGPIAPPGLCNGLQVPVVAFDQVYSFDRAALLGSIPRPASVPEDQDKQFRAAAAELLDRLLQLADNAGATDEHRAVNYLAVRYPTIYATAAEAHARNASLTGVEVRPSRLSGTRSIVDVIFSFGNRQTDVTEKFFARVDVTEEFPFLVTRMSPFYDR
ncbi:MAG TPA: hypothetical protein VLX28_17850 [Thermoanaerobaculia bacterium]|nr:hypothetical protein [Thermoanaerobaculia bacterium]